MEGTTTIYTAISSSYSTTISDAAKTFVEVFLPYTTQTEYNTVTASTETTITGQYRTYVLVELPVTSLDVISTSTSSTLPPFSSTSSSSTPSSSTPSSLTSLTSALSSSNPSPAIVPPSTSSALAAPSNSATFSHSLTAQGSTASSVSSLTSATTISTSKTALSPSAVNLKSSNSISTGETAGIAIGCAVIGAIMAAVVVCLLLRRKSNQRQSFEMAPLKSAIGPSATAYPVAAKSRNTDSEDGLPPPVDATTLGNQLSHLQMLVSQHAQQGFYVEGGVKSSTMNNVDRISLTGMARGALQPAQLMSGLINPRTRTEAIIFVIAMSIFPDIDPNNPRARLLPPVNAAFARATSPTSRQDGREQFLSRWRVLTGYLQTDQYVTHAFTGSDERSAAVQETARTIDSVLGPLVIPAENSPRSKNLKAIIQKAAMFGHTLVSQPAGWTFDWKRPRFQEESVVILPGLVQVTDQHGRLLVNAASIGEKKLSRELLMA